MLSLARKQSPLRPAALRRFSAPLASPSSPLPPLPPLPRPTTAINPRLPPSPPPPHPLLLRRRSFSFQSPLVAGVGDDAQDDDGGGGLCPGCGVRMQGSDPTLPGFFLLPSPKSVDYRAPLDRRLPSLSLDDPRLSLSLKSGLFPPDDDDDDDDDDDEEEEEADSSSSSSSSAAASVVVCARCHSLRHYGRVKEQGAENLLPDFDFDRAVAPRMTSPSGPRSVVLAVVDAADFDGSFPRRLARLAAAAAAAHSDAWRRRAPANAPRLLLAATKLDLLPLPHSSPAAAAALEEWARARAHAAGAGRVEGVHLVSAARGWGVRALLERARELAGPRGNVWAVGAQNAGKSTLINAMARCAGGTATHLTEAPVPGTTLGIVRVDGVLGGHAKLFDTPGILHPYQITTRLTREEQKLVHMGKELRPRTYRIKAGHSIHIGGLIRLDVEELSVNTIYITVWASSLLPLHMGKTENASAMMDNHFGLQLQPPIGEKRIKELGKWVRKEFRVAGDSWDANSVDIAAAGLGWFAIGLKGEAVLGVWTYDGVDVVSRSSLIRKRASIFEEAGFTVSKIVSKADCLSNKVKHNKSGKKKQAQCRLCEADSPTVKPDETVSA
ncbi:GTP-binding protein BRASSINAZOLE INSENSITIVE PALE GREEN 2, chloroplastic [Ananas comosus]|uniref:GTP-binding protein BRASSINAZOLE INSENSITIVE PALE GREEN 2, chloroplastic n=1 Tax=Ananas comosus TaxID=4615 RepID=A0A6P5FVZ2_ANACO|nr:GTP-binding protein BRASSINAZOLE INSENSITIVE PALE GREEN 2, chloroplastic [Ananas comosus]